jgi:hypothetical protein
MAAMTRMIATTISNSINENPLLERISKPPYKGEQIEGGRLICCSFVAKLLGPAKIRGNSRGRKQSRLPPEIACQIRCQTTKEQRT